MVGRVATLKKAWVALGYLTASAIFVAPASIAAALRGQVLGMVFGTLSMALILGWPWLFQGDLGHPHSLNRNFRRATGLIGSGWCVLLFAPVFLGFSEIDVAQLSVVDWLVLGTTLIILPFFLVIFIRFLAGSAIPNFAFYLSFAVLALALMDLAWTVVQASSHTVTYRNLTAYTIAMAAKTVRLLGPVLLIGVYYAALRHDNRV